MFDHFSFDFLDLILVDADFLLESLNGFVEGWLAEEGVGVVVVVGFVAGRVLLLHFYRWDYWTG